MTAVAILVIVLSKFLAHTSYVLCWQYPRCFFSTHYAPSYAGIVVGAYRTKLYHTIKNTLLRLLVAIKHIASKHNL